MSERQFPTLFGRVDIKCNSTQIYSQSIYPTLSFEMIFNAVQQTGQSQTRASTSVQIMNITGEVFIKENNSLGFFQARYPSVSCALPNGRAYNWFYLQLDHYGLNQIEKLRESGDLNLKMQIRFSLLDQNGALVYYDDSLPIYIAKSDWVEKLLAVIRFKEILMIEIPKLDSQDFSEITVHLQDAWKQQSMGEPNNVVTECRKALEGLTKMVTDAGFKTIDTESGKLVPDWKKFFDSENVGDVVGSINKKFYGFVAPGAHFGKELSVTDSYFAIMITHAILYYVIKRFQNKSS